MTTIMAEVTTRIHTLTIRIAALPDWDLPKPRPGNKNIISHIFTRLHRNQPITYLRSVGQSTQNDIPTDEAKCS